MAAWWRPVISAEQALSQAASATQQRESALEQQRIPESQFVKFEVAQESAAEDGEPGLSQSDSPPLSDGYGPGGSSVQDPAQGPSILSDRVA